MNYSSHHIITELVCKKLNLREIIGDEGVEDAIKYSMLPDYVKDIFFKIGPLEKKHSMFGHELAAFDHFVRPTRDCHYMGYCMSADGSITKFKKPDFCEVMIDDEDWDQALKKNRTKHPVQELLDMPGYTHNGLEITYSTGAITAEWIEKNTDESKWWRAAASDGHLACDSCVRDHIWGTLFGGHQTYEGTIDEVAAQSAERICEISWKSFRDVIENPRMPRTIIEMQAEKTGAWSGRPKPEWAILYGLKTTAEMFSWFIKKYGK